MKTALIAFGGNAIRKASESGGFDVQLANTRRASSVIADLVQKDYHIVVTHGNGPQVGDILLQNEIAAKSVASMPLDACVSESQGLIGYMLIQSMDNEFRKRGMDVQALCVLTRSIVGKDDPAFDNPSKPVGDYYSKQESERLTRLRGWKMVFDSARGGYRRVVPSPEPVAIAEADLLKSFFRNRQNNSEILVVSGGGGIPVVRNGRGYMGVEAVIDKDLAAQVVATALGVEELFILTDVDSVFVNFGTRKQKALRKATVSQMRKHMDEGQFAEGSMLPKVDAAIRFIEAGGERAIITSQGKLFDAIAGKRGTTIVE